MSVPLLTIDAFTARAFAGNPAAVCWLEAPAEADAEWMQSVAAEMNLSETAFVGPHPEGYSLRWFTPAIEVPLCGHATLASAHALWTTGRAKPDETIRFHTASGELTAIQDAGWIELDFPAIGSEAGDPPAEVLRAMAVQPVETCVIPADAQAAPNWILRLSDEAAVRAAAPDFGALGATGTAVMLTAESASDELDFVSRYFAPSAGIDEDPVTGFAHCCLGPFWGERLGKNDMTALQASKRTGVVGVRLRGERVKLRGQAVTILEGTLFA